MVDDVEAAMEEGNDLAVGERDAGAADLALVAQVSQQRAVAATQVQHAAAALDPAGDSDQVGAHSGGAARMGGNGTHAGHPSAQAGTAAAEAGSPRPSSRAMRS